MLSKRKRHPHPRLMSGSAKDVAEIMGLRSTLEPVAPRVKTSNQTEGFSGQNRKVTLAFGRNGKQVPSPQGWVRFFRTVQGLCSLQRPEDNCFWTGHLSAR